MLLRKITWPLLAALSLVLAACGATPTDISPTAVATLVDQLPPEVALQAQQTLSEVEEIPIEQIQITDLEQVEWPDGCLGLPEDGELCTQVLTSGWRVELTANGQNYVLRTDETGANIRLEEAG